MRYALTSKNVSTIDATIVRSYGVPEIELMETASRAAADCILHIVRERFPNTRTIAVVCGQGNNGGDGFCIARMLCEYFTISAVWSGEVATLSASARQNLHRLPSEVQCYTLPLVNALSADIVVDAVLGVGLKLPVREPAYSLIRHLELSSRPVISIDVPSGLDATTGVCDDTVVHASATVTMQATKTGLIRGRGPEVSGTIHVVDIGVPDDVMRRVCLSTMLEDCDIVQALPTRSSNTSKFDYGRVAILGGTIGMRGAPSMAAHAAIALGAGLVDLIAPSIHPLTPREIVTHTVPAHADGTIAAGSYEEVTQVLRKATVVAIGPGLGTNADTIGMAARAIDSLNADVPVVLDADGLRCFSILRVPRPIILTPHLGEFARLLQIDRSALVDTSVEQAQGFAASNACVLHVKNVPSVTTDGTLTTYLTRGTPAMATAGSGDVLTGIIAAMCAQGLAPLSAARIGAYIHARAGENAAGGDGKRTLMAHELIDAARLFVGSISPGAQP